MPNGEAQSGQNSNQRASSPVSMGFVRRVMVAVVITLAAAGFVLLTWFAWQIWFVLIAGILLAILLCSLAHWLTKFLRVPHPWSVIVVVILLLLILSGGGYLLDAPVRQQIQQIQQQLPKAVNQVADLLSSVGININLRGAGPSSDDVTNLVQQWLSQIAGLFKVTLEAVALFLVFLFLGLYLAINPTTYFQGFLDLFPPARRPRLEEVFLEVNWFLRYWLLGQLISMTAVGTMIGFGLYLIDVPFPLVLGILAGVLDFIPIFGPVLAAIPAILLGFLHSPMTALYVVVVFVAANQIESHLLLPWIHRYTVSLPPALTVFALALMGTLFGFFGLLLAAPVTASCMVLIKRLYVEDVLEAGHRQKGSSG